MSTTTDPPPRGPVEAVLRANDLSDPNLRLGIAAALGDSGFNDRDRYDAFGWEVNPDEEEYVGLYLRNPYGGGLIDKAAQLAWRHDPDIEEAGDDAPEDTTDFEDAVQRLARAKDLWAYCTRVHKAAGFGEFALIFINFDDRDNLDRVDEPVEYDDGGLDNIRGFRVVPQMAVDEVEHGGFDSERWGEPEYYTIDWGEDLNDDLDDEAAASRVHHSRVIEVPSKPPLAEEYSSRPRMERYLNTLYDIEKLLGSAAEMSYRGADKGLHINYDPTKVNPDAIDTDEERENIQQWLHGLQPTFNTVGAEVNDLGGEIRDPSGALEAELKSLSAATGFSKQFIEGAAAGEIASSETNMRNDFGEIRERQNQYVEPYIVRRALDTLIEAGVLSRPSTGQYDVHWPDLFELSDSEAADIEKTRSAVAKAIGLMGEAAQEYIKTGEFPEDAPAMPPMDESNPAVANQFERANDSWDPDLHPRDGEGKFAETPLDDALGAIQSFAQVNDVTEREAGPFAGKTEIEFTLDTDSDQRNLSALALDTDAEEYTEGGIVRYGKIQPAEGADTEFAQEDLTQIGRMIGVPRNVSMDMGDFGSDAPHVRVDGPVDRKEMESFLQDLSVAIDEWFYPYDPEGPAKESEELKQAIRANGYDTGTDQSANESDTSLDDVDLTPPASAQNNAQRVLDWRAADDTDVAGMTETGWGTAETLASGDELDPEKVQQIAAWFARHPPSEADLNEGVEEPWRDNGRVAILGWGGETMRDWVAGKRERLAEIGVLDPVANADYDHAHILTGNATRYSEGDPVQTPQGFGIVAEVRTEDFEGKDGTVEASPDSPTYVVALKDARVGVEFYTASQLSETELPETDVEDPTGDVAQTANAGGVGDRLLRALNLRSNDWSMPESWRESDTPARVILLKAWAGMNGQFDCGGGCCKGEMMSSGMSDRASDQFCAAMKDEVFGGWEGWRK